MALSPYDIAGIEDDLQDDERMVRDSVARFVDAEVLPQIGRHFEDHHFPRELIAPMARLGLLGSSLEGYGCAGLNAVSYGLICQELERGDSALRSFVSVQSSLCMYPIFTYGSESQRERWLPAMARGEAIGCFGLTESHGGSDPLNMNTTARRRGEDWVLNGSKMWITNAPIADVAVVWALTDEGVRGFLVERGMKGFESREIERKFSLRASATGALFFDDVLLPASSLLPGTTVGLKAPLSCLTQARFGIAWGVLGAAMACFEEAVSYAKTRVMFDKPIGGFQIQQVRLADMLTELTKAQLVSLHLGRLKDAGNFTPTQVSLAKRNNVSIATDIAREARRLLGGNGILAEYGAMRHMANLESVYTYEGTHDVHSLSLGQAITGLSAFK